MSADIKPNWPYWRETLRSNPRTSPSKAAHLLCNIEPPAGSLYATARPQDVDRLLRNLRLVHEEARATAPGSSFVEIIEWVEVAELLEAVSAGKLPGLGTELLRAVRGPAAPSDNDQQRREAALRAWLKKKKIPESEWLDLRGWSLKTIYISLKTFRPKAFDIELSTFKDHFWRDQEFCRLHR